MSKKNINLAVALLVLLGLAYLYQGPLKNWNEKKEETKNFLSGIDFEKVDKIEITKNNILTVLEKDNEQWRVGGTKDFYLDEEASNSLVSAVNESIKADIEVVSDNESKKAEFKTDENNAIKVKLFLSGEVGADFAVGKLSSDYTGTYISSAGSSETYLVKVSGLNRAFDRSDWYNKKIFSSDQEKISKIRFQYPTREFTIERSGEGEDVKWEGTLPYVFNVNEEKIVEILKIMSELDATDIPKQTFEGTGLEKNLIIIEATGDGIDNTLMIGDARKGDLESEQLYYAKKGNSDNIYLIAKEQRDELDKQIRELK